jgi:hypothetical protein
MEHYPISLKKKKDTTETQLSFITTLFNLALQKVIHSIRMVPSGIQIGKEQLKILAYADDIVRIGKNEIEIRQLFVEMEQFQKVWTKNKQYIYIYHSGKEKQFKTK